MKDASWFVQPFLVVRVLDAVSLVCLPCICQFSWPMFRLMAWRQRGGKRGKEERKEEMKRGTRVPMGGTVEVEAQR